MKDSFKEGLSNLFSKLNDDTKDSKDEYKSVPEVMDSFSEEELAQLDKVSAMKVNLGDLQFLDVTMLLRGITLVEEEIDKMYKNTKKVEDMGSKAEKDAHRSLRIMRESCKKLQPVLIKMGEYFMQQSGELGERMFDKDGQGMRHHFKMMRKLGF